ncbi:MAG: transposase [Spirochaetia bacterium]|nr:transposase [Spirochaetia bacterium]
MIKRTRYGKEFKDSIVNEISMGGSSVAQISKRESISAQTLRNWVENAVIGKSGTEQNEIATLKRENEQLALALGELAFDNYILKKFQKFQEQKRKSAISSGTLSPRKSESSQDVPS